MSFAASSATGCVVDAQAAAGDLAARLAVGLDEARLHERGQHAEPAASSAAAISTVGRPCASVPCSNVCCAVLGRGLGLVAAVQHAR